MPCLLASAAVWMRSGSDTLTADIILHTNLTSLLVCLHSFWLQVSFRGNNWPADMQLQYVCRRSEVCKCGKSKSNSSDTCSTKGVITEDSDVWRSNMLACIFGVIPSIPQQSADRQEWRVRGLWRDGKAVIWILAQAGTRRWRKKEEHLIYLSFSPPKQSWNARRGERRQKSEDRWLWCDNCRGRSRLTFLPNVWVLPL